MTQTSLLTNSAPVSTTASPTQPRLDSTCAKKKRLAAVPGLTGPVLLVATPQGTARKNFFSDVLHLAVDVLELRAWRDMDPIACFMLAGFAAVIAQPLVFGSLGTSIVALMTPLK